MFLRPQYRAGINRVDDTVAGMRHGRAVVVADGDGNSMDLGPWG